MKLALDRLAVRHPAASHRAGPALGPLSLNIEAGEQLAVVGPSGAGKTTLLHALACALRPAQGQVLMADLDPWRLSTQGLQRHRSKLFLAPQVPPLPPRQRVVTAVLAARLPQWSLATSLRSLIYPADIPGAQAALAHFDVEDKLWDRVDRLSGGERQRVALARTALTQASLWLIDEPLSSLDPTRALQAIDALSLLASQRGATLVVTLHQVEVARRFPRVLGLREGALQFDVPGSELHRDRLSALYAQHEEELLDALSTTGSAEQRLDALSSTGSPGRIDGRPGHSGH